MKADWRLVVLYIAVLGMEGCWLYALMALLNMVTDAHLSVLVCLLLYPVSFGFNKLLQRLKWPGVFLLTISWLVWAIAMLLLAKAQLFSGLSWSDTQWLLAIPRAIAAIIYTFKPELLVLVGSAVFWWLGRRLAYLRTDFAILVGEFQFGLVILLITFFIASALEVQLTDSLPVTLAFFLFALSGISIAHTLEGKGWLSGLYPGHWSGLLFISLGLILLLGLLISWVMTPDFIQLIIGALKWMWGLFTKVMEFIASLLPAPEPAELPPGMAMTANQTAEEGFKWSIPEWLRNGLSIGLGILWLGIIVLALWRVSSDIFSWLRHKLAGMAGAEFERVPSTFGADLLGVLKRIVRGLSRVKLLFRLGRGPAALPEVVSVRQIYRQFLRWAAKGGFARNISQTPHEYGYAMAGVLPEAQDDLSFITQQYVAVRYGTALPAEDELHQLRQSWHRVRKKPP